MSGLRLHNLNVTAVDLRSAVPASTMHWSHDKIQLSFNVAIIWMRIHVKKMSRLDLTLVMLNCSISILHSFEAGIANAISVFK